MGTYILHFSEIGTKGLNRPFFQRKLISNLKHVAGARSVSMDFSAIIVDIDNPESLSLIPGVANYAKCMVCDTEINTISDACIRMLKNKKFKSFKIVCKRQNKKFKFTSLQLANIIGDILRKEFGAKVDLNTPNIKIFIEICRNTYIYSSTDIFRGIGGLPVSSSGSVLSLLSGGIDSAVASFLMMKRGCKVYILHFINRDIGMSEEKITKIAEKLSKVQGKTEIHFVEFGDIQKKIISFVPAKYRMLIYRVFMVIIANKIGEELNINAIVTGDNIAQVASQTLSNIRSVYTFSKLPIISPLFGMNKNEIIDIAKRIGTYNVSIIKSKECCSLLISKHPVTKSTYKQLKRFVEKIDASSVEKALIRRKKVIV